MFPNEFPEEFFRSHSVACYWAHYRAASIYRLTGKCVRYWVYKVSAGEWAIQRLENSVPEAN